MTRQIRVGRGPKRHAPQRRGPRGRVPVGRLLLGAAGVAVLAYGIDRLAHEPAIPHPGQVAEWIVGAIILHDGLIAPVVLAVGYLVSRLVPAPARAIVQGGLVVAGAVVVIAVPLLVKPVPSIPTVLPLDYGRSLAIVLGSVVAATASLVAVRLARTRRLARARRPPREKAPDPPR